LFCRRHSAARPWRAKRGGGESGGKLLSRRHFFDGADCRYFDV